MTPEKARELAEQEFGKTEFKVALAPNSQGNLYVNLDDAAPRGVFVPTWTQLKPGTEVSVELSFPGGESFTVKCTAEWGRETERTTTWPGIGVQFTDLTAEQRQTVERFAKNRPPFLFDF